MHVGMAAIFQNPEGLWSDAEVYRNDLRLVDLAEPLGFQSIWGVEHHFTDYTMCPDVLQFLSYAAGRTREILLGSMVVVLPWHDPMRVAEQVAMLDNLSGGRLILGLGRGLGRVEFDGFRVDMADSRPMFIESAKMLIEGLETGTCEFDGEHVKQPRREIRPRPLKSFNSSEFAPAAAHFTRPSAAMNWRGIVRPEIGKLLTARCVCAPQSASSGTWSSPILSFSMRYPLSLIARRAPYNAIAPSGNDQLVYDSRFARASLHWFCRHESLYFKSPVPGRRTLLR